MTQILPLRHCLRPIKDRSTHVLYRESDIVPTQIALGNATVDNYGCGAHDLDYNRYHAENHFHAKRKSMSASMPAYDVFPDEHYTDRHVHSKRALTGCPTELRSLYMVPRDRGSLLTTFVGSSC